MRKLRKYKSAIPVEIERRGYNKMYDEFKRRNPGTAISREMFRDYIREFNKRLAQFILDGNVFRLGNGLGYLHITKRKRDFTRRHANIDWGETNKLRAKGINRLVYYTSDWIYHWNWTRAKGSHSGIMVRSYDFNPTRGPGMNTRLLAKKVKEDPLVVNRYIVDNYAGDLKYR